MFPNSSYHERDCVGLVLSCLPLFFPRHSLFDFRTARFLQHPHIVTGVPCSKYYQNCHYYCNRELACLKTKSD